MPKPLRYKHGWQVYLRYGKERIHKRFPDSDYLDAFQEARSFIARFRKGHRPTPAGDSLKDAIRDYLNYTERTGRKKARTVDSDRLNLAKFERWAAACDITALSQVTLSVIERFEHHVYHTRKPGTEPRHRNATWNRQLSALSVLLKWAVEKGRIPINPLASQKMRKPERRRAPRWFTSEELQRLFVTIDRRAHVIEQAFFRLLAFAGLRVGEAVRLQWGHLDLKRKTITITDDTKNDTYRVIPIAADLMPFLESLPTRTGLVFVNSAGHRFCTPNAWQKRLDTIVKQTGLQHASPHAFRHSFCTYLWEQGIQPRRIQYLMGHAKIETTLNYSHLIPEREGILDGLYNTDRATG